ncbi:cation/H(+) antiporter 4-like [Dorcoceras hygrometricum]|uniref:Cation/H(+) antiporter 4-like n=1 Tax=Dorcoceras hygrometricum TaxID=472368 RepID=A0A2Z7B8L1_9LAMI|nr:cation/H(+) antiporter 4-like [Dorcoceras hygrometricum]
MFESFELLEEEHEGASGRCSFAGKFGSSVQVPELVVVWPSRWQIFELFGTLVVVIVAQKLKVRM